jgi:hypothetical protein
MDLKPVCTRSEIEACFAVFVQLRPHLKDKFEFYEKVQAQILEGYQIIANN